METSFNSGSHQIVNLPSLAVFGLVEHNPLVGLGFEGVHVVICSFFLIHFLRVGLLVMSVRIVFVRIRIVTRTGAVMHSGAES